MSEHTAVRIAEALERLVMVIATLLPGDEAPAEPAETIYQTQQGPMVMREGRLVLLD